MKYTIVDLNNPNEPTLFTNFVSGNNSFDSFFRNFTTKTSLYLNANYQFKLLECTQIAISNCTKLDNNNCNIDE